MGYNYMGCVVDRKRLYERYSISQAVIFLNVITQTVNLSMGGMSIKTSCNIPDNKYISIGIGLTDQVFIQLFGQLIWSKCLSTEEQIYGIKFIDLTENVRNTLQSYLNV